MLRFSSVAAVLTLAVTAPVGASFVDVASDVGLLAGHDLAGICNPPISAGAAWADFDGDGDVDLFLSNHGGANQLYRNEGDPDLDGLPDFVDVAAVAGVADGAGVGLGTVFVDYDNDGDQDLYVASWKGGETEVGNILYANQLVETGSSDFVAVTDSGLADFGRNITAAWADYDEDGDLDVYLAKHGRCNDVFGDNEDRLFRNDGGTFTDVTESTLCVGCFALTDGLGFAPGWFDFDNDGDLDLYVVNDDINDIHSGNVLWRNDGPDGAGGWLFTDVSQASGTDIALNGMGLGIGDVNNDGWLDLAFSNIGPNKLLRHKGDGTYKDVSAAAGIEREIIPSGDNSITWGTVFLDYDADRLLDLFFVAGYIATPPFDQPNAFFRNLGTGRFEDISAAIGLDHVGRGRGAAVADFDEDGRPDLLVTNFGEAPLLMHNGDLAAGSTNGYLAFTVEGTVSNRDAIGTRIWVRNADGVTQMREISTGSTHGGGDERLALFGLGAEPDATVIVRWPDGQVQGLGVFTADQRVHLVQPEFLVSGPDPGIPGQENTLHVTGATPGAMVYLVRAKEVGNTEVPGCPGVIVNLKTPNVRASALADGSGNVDLVDTVGPGATGGLYQAIDSSTCDTSNRLRATFQ